MTQEAVQAATDDRMPVCLNDIDGFEHVTARMPTADECRANGLRGDVPVLVIRRHGKEQLCAADLVRLTIDPGQPAGPDAVREAARYVIEHIIEDLENVHAKIGDLWDATEAPPQRIIKLAARYRQERAGESS